MSTTAEPTAGATGDQAATATATEEAMAEATVGPTEATADAGGTSTGGASNLGSSPQEICDAVAAADLGNLGAPSSPPEPTDTGCFVPLDDGILGLSAQLPADYDGATGQDLLDAAANLLAFQAESGPTPVPGLGQGALLLEGTTTGNSLFVLVNDDFVLNVNSDASTDDLIAAAGSILAAGG